MTRFVMKQKGIYLFYIISSLFFTGLYFISHSLLEKRSGLPPEIRKESVVKIDGIELRNSRDIMYVLSHRSIGDQIVLKFRDSGSGEIKEQTVTLVTYYSGRFFPGFYLALSLVVLGLGCLVILFRPQDPKAHVFFWLSALFSTTAVVTGAFHTQLGNWRADLTTTAFFFGFALSPVLIVRFALMFGNLKRKFPYWILFIPAVVFIIVLEIIYLRSSRRFSLPDYWLYEDFSFFFRIFILAVTLSAIILFLQFFRQATSQETRAQLKWVFIGLFFGLGPFLFLAQLPRLIGFSSLITDETSDLFFIILPIALTFTILKFRLMDVDFFINKGLVYSFLTIFTVGFYLFLVSVFQKLFAGIFSIRGPVIMAGSALTAAAAFHPARHLIQGVVDKAFFRKKYDYQTTLSLFNKSAYLCAGDDDLLQLFKQTLNEALPLESVSIGIFDERARISARLSQMSVSGMKYFLKRMDEGESYDFVAWTGAVLKADNIDFSFTGELEKEGIHLIIRLPFHSTSQSGLVLAGPKKSGAKFTADDLMLIRTMSDDLSLYLERIKLQEDVIRERAEKQKLDEMNRMKTEFVSTVSHELRTPMSTLLGISELLQNEKLTDMTKRLNLIRLMAGSVAG
ncbi:MAG: histidine kinase dimerization/phospho-acceptor domain-containing protein [Acidobacteriota bacterium]